MMGNEEEPGVVPQAVDDVFAYIRKVCHTRTPCKTLHAVMIIP